MKCVVAAIFATTMSTLYDRIQSTADFLRSKTAAKPVAGIILGSGLGGLADAVEDAVEISYDEIPGFPQSTVQGHAGKLIFGLLSGRPVIMMAGRFHYYEGYSMEDVTLPVRVMRALGAETLLVSNAAGGMHKEHRVGDIVIISDLINLFPEHPLRGPNDERLGPRFPDMSAPFTLELIERAKSIAASQGLRIRTGVYAGLQGPTFETRAEYHWLHTIGADLVGMSTVPEVIVAVHGGMQVFGASIVTDLGIREDLNKITHEEVLAAAAEAAPKLAGLIQALTATL